MMKVLLGLGAGILLAGAARAGALDPQAFASLGTLNLTTNSYVLDSSGPKPRLLDAATNTVFTGVFYDQSLPSGSNFWGFDTVVAVFDFTSVSIASNVTVTLQGTNPVVILSRGDATVNGILDASGGNGQNGTGSFGGDGDGSGGRGGAGGGAGGTGGVGQPAASQGDDGAGPGGSNGSGAFGSVGGTGSQGDGAGFGGRGGSGFGGLVDGSAYGDLRQYLQGGAGGGGTGTDVFLTQGAGGGGGAGGLELGAVGNISVGGQILANGGAGGGGGSVLAGGGSGGGIFLHAATVQFTVAGAGLLANGGEPNGAGGRILVLTNSGPDLTGTFSVNPGTAGGEAGVVALGPPGVVPLLLELTITRASATQLQISWPTTNGTNYQLETNTSLNAVGWHAWGDPVAGTGQTNTVQDAISRSNVFYRVHVL